MVYTLIFILLCETYLNNINYNQFKIPGYTFVQTNRSHVGLSGVGIYIREKITFKIRDISLFIEGEFESIFVEATHLKKSYIIWEIYRVPNSNVNLS